MSGGETEESRFAANRQATPRSGPPTLDGKGMQIEARRVDMRDVFPNLNAMAPVPRGETIYRGPARFEAVSPLQERLSVTLTEEGDKVLVTLVYGDRRLPLTFTR